MNGKGGPHAIAAHDDAASSSLHGLYEKLAGLPSVLEQSFQAAIEKLSGATATNETAGGESLERLEKASRHGSVKESSQQEQGDLRSQLTAISAKPKSGQGLVSAVENGFDELHLQKNAGTNF